MLANPDIDEAPIGAVIGRLVDDGQRLVRAEIAVQKATIQKRVEGAKSGAVFLVVAVLLAQAAVTALLVGLVIGLAVLVGGVAAGLIVAIGGLAVAGLLGWLGAKKLAAPAEVPADAAARVTS